MSLDNVLPMSLDNPVTYVPGRFSTQGCWILLAQRKPTSSFGDTLWEELRKYVVDWEAGEAHEPPRSPRSRTS
jgi:hypothetical protein